MKPLGIPLPLLYFKANLLFPYVSTPSGTTGRFTFRNFSCMVNVDNFLHGRGGQQRWALDWTWIGSGLCRILWNLDWNRTV